MIIVINYNNMFNSKSKITNKVLGYFFINSRKKHYINELAVLLEVDPGNLFRKLKELEIEGVLRSEMAGNQRYFFLNKEYSLLKELKKTYETKYGVVPFLEKRFGHLPKLKEAYIFGSFANGALSPESDIDLLLVGEHSSLAAKRDILALQHSLKREINVVDITSDELKRKMKQKDEFFSRIFSQPIIRLKLS